MRPEDLRGGGGGGESNGLKEMERNSFSLSGITEWSLLDYLRGKIKTKLLFPGSAHTTSVIVFVGLDRLDRRILIQSTRSTQV